MSLKSFHIFFISVSVAFFAGFGLWFLFADPLAVEVINVFAGLVCFSIGGGLVIYAARFLRKFKNLESF
ncbi:MAG: hypothetical protein HRF44_10290 [Ignavibacterium sp.]|jgi:hypothetical protein